MADYFSDRENGPRARTEQVISPTVWAGLAGTVNPSGYQSKFRGAEHGLTEAAYNQGLLDQCVVHDIRVVGIADHWSVAGRFLTLQVQATEKQDKNPNYCLYMTL